MPIKKLGANPFGNQEEPKPAFAPAKAPVKAPVKKIGASPFGNEANSTPAPVKKIGASPFGNEPSSTSAPAPVKPAAAPKKIANPFG